MGIVVAEGNPSTVFYVYSLVEKQNKVDFSDRFFYCKSDIIKILSNNKS